MGLHRDFEDDQSFSEYGFEDDPKELENKKRVRKMIEDRLERKRLKEEFQDEFEDSNDEFDWENFDKEE